MKKKVAVFSFIIVALFAATLGLTACNKVQTDDNGLRYKLYKKSYYIIVDIDKDNYDSEIVIPCEFKGLPVKTIEKNAFAGCRSLTSITISESVTTIEAYAFDDCDSLTIYCEAENKIDGWDDNWNCDNCPVVWNCKNNEVADDGYIYTPLQTE